MNPDQLESTSVNPVKGTGLTRSKAFDPVDIFVSQNRQAQAWFLIACLATLSAIATPIWITQNLSHAIKVVLVDKAANVFYVDAIDMEEATELHSLQSELVALAFLNRNPNGFDLDHLLKRLFLVAAHKKAAAQWESEAREMQLKSLHQKPEIETIEVLEVRPNFIFTRVTGHLVRNGVFQGRTFSESLAFTLDLKLQRNNDISRSDRYPLTVSDFKYETHPHL